MLGGIHSTNKHGVSSYIEGGYALSAVALLIYPHRPQQEKETREEHLENLISVGTSPLKIAMMAKLKRKGAEAKKMAERKSREKEAKQKVTFSTLSPANDPPLRRLH